MQITNDIKYIGVNDRAIDLFEGQYVVPNGMAYNSYVILDEKVAVMDTVDARFTHEWLDNLSSALGSRRPDYLIVQHMEPDHSANIVSFAKTYPEAKIVATAKAFAILTHHKVKDDIADEGLRKRILANAVSPITGNAMCLAGMDELSAIAEEKLSAISELEKNKTPSVDLPARLFGELLGEIFAFGLEGNDRLVTYECGAALGRFIYAADAAEDYYKDRDSGSYNPYVISYEGKDLTPENRATIKCALIHECKNIERAIDLMPFERKATIENILKNIIYLGLPKRISFLDEPKDECKIGEIN